jgi:hypothetical protein
MNLFLRLSRRTLARSLVGFERYKYHFFQSNGCGHSFKKGYDLKIRCKVSKLLVDLLQSWRVGFKLSYILLRRVIENGNMQYSIQHFSKIGSAVRGGQKNNTTCRLDNVFVVQIVLTHDICLEIQSAQH